MKLYTRDTFVDYMDEDGEETSAPYTEFFYCVARDLGFKYPEAMETWALHYQISPFMAVHKFDDFKREFWGRGSLWDAAEEQFERVSVNLANVETLESWGWWEEDGYVFCPR